MGREGSGVHTRKAFLFEFFRKGLDAVLCDMYKLPYNYQILKIN